MNYRIMFVLLTGIIALWNSASYSQPAAAMPVKLQLTPDESLTSASFVKAYTVKSENQFFPGNLGDTFFGDRILETDKFRLGIARPDKPAMGYVQGGTLMDITVGSGNPDYFGSLNTTADPRSTSSMVTYNSAEVVQTNASSAAIVLNGQVGSIAPPLSVKTIYSAEKGAARLSISSEFINQTSKTIWIQPADIIDWGEAKVFAEGSGFKPTSSTATFITGSVDDYSITYFTSGTKGLEGFHNDRDSVVLACGTADDLKLTSPNPRSSNPEDIKLPSEFGNIGASLSPGPGLILFPGTESRYIMEGFGTPQKQPIYVPRESLQIKDGQPTVTRESRSEVSLFNPPQENIGQICELKPGESFVFTRFMVIGDADWSKSARIAYRDKNMTTGILAGVLMEAGTNHRISDGTIQISGGPLWDGSGPAPAILQTKTKPDGTFMASLPPGPYRINAMANGRISSGENASLYEVKPGETPSIAALTMTPVSRLRIAISEAETETSSPLPVKLTIIAKPPHKTPDYGVHTDVLQGARNVRYLPYGADIFPITPGRYKLIVSRGIEYDILERDIEVTAGQDVTVSGVLPHVMKGLLPPMVSMDAGVVTSVSGSGYASAESRAIQAVCEGLQIIVSGDYEHTTDLQTAIISKQLESWIKAFAGRRLLLGKDNLTADVLIYPLDRQTSASLDKALTNLQGLPADVALSDLRKKFPELIIEISRPNHPEAGYLNAFSYEKTTRDYPENGLPPTDFDSMQLIEGKRVGQYPESYPPYIALQRSRMGVIPEDRGTTISPTGSSFSRIAFNQEVGYPRTYLYLDKTKKLSEITESDITKAIRNQHFMVTNGPILLFDVRDPETGSFSIRPGDTLNMQTTTVCHLRARVAVAPWITLSGVATKENGLHGSTVMINKASTEVLRYPGVSDSLGSNIFTRQIKSDTILEGLAYSERRSLAPVVPDAPEDFGGPVYPFAWSAPIFADQNGDGKILIIKNQQ